MRAFKRSPPLSTKLMNIRSEPHPGTKNCSNLLSCRIIFSSGSKSNTKNERKQLVTICRFPSIFLGQSASWLRIQTNFLNLDYPGLLCRFLNGFLQLRNQFSTTGQLAPLDDDLPIRTHQHKMGNIVVCTFIIWVFRSQLRCRQIMQPL